MAIPKNVPGPGIPTNRPQGNPQPTQRGIPRLQNPTGDSNRGVGPQSDRPRQSLPKPAVGPTRPSVRNPRPDMEGLPSHNREYSFGQESSRPRRVTGDSGRIVNPYDPEDEETFSPISIDDQIEYDSSEDLADREAREADEARLEIDRRQQQRREELERLRLEDEARRADSEAAREEVEVEAEISRRKAARESEEANKKDKVKTNKKGQELYVDEESLTVEPFAGKKKLRVNDFDNRKNLRQRSQIIQFIALGLIGVIAAVALKTAVFPAESLTPADVQGIVADTTGSTGFPMNSGEGFAKDFMKAYLTVNGDPASKAALGYYYSGNLTSADSPNRSTSQGFIQTIAFGPTVYSAAALTDHSARYTIGALVQTSDANGQAPEDGSNAKWEFFNVNVYYDKEAGSFSITPDSPTVIPPVEVGDPSKLPVPVPIGDEKAPNDVVAEIQSVVFGFIKGYAVSSPIDHSTLDQYIINDSENEDLKKGLNGTYVLAGAERDAIQYTAYLTPDPNVLKVDVSVNWRDQLGAADSNTKLEYRSNYVITLEKQSNGKYLVSKFAPKYYAADTE